MFTIINSLKFQITVYTYTIIKTRPKELETLLNLTRPSTVNFYTVVRSEL